MSKLKQYSLSSFFSYVGQIKLRFWAVFLTFTMSGIALSVIPVYIGKLVAAAAETPGDQSAIFGYVWILIALSAAHDLLWRLSEYVFLRLLVEPQLMYEKILFNKVISKPYNYFVDKFTGKVSAYIDTIGQGFRDLMEDVCFEYAAHIVNLVVVSIILTSVNVLTGLSFMLGLVLMFIFGRYSLKINNKYEKIFTDVRSTKSGIIIDAIANFVNVKSFRKEAYEEKVVSQELSKTLSSYNKSYLAGMLFWGSMSAVVRHTIWPATILLNVSLFLADKISLAELTTFMSVILLFSGFIWDIVWKVSQFNLKLAKIEEAHLYLFGPVNIIKEDTTRQADKYPKTDFNKILALNNITFSYPDAKNAQVLSDLNLNIKQGEKIGIVGKSGSGKTTLIKLLIGYYDTLEHQFVLDGKPISSKQLASIIAYVPQDTSLFHRSIADNIAYATDRAVSREEIVTAAKKAHADEFITKINQGYDALVGERGVKLSSGQRQRIAIARAFLDNKSILVLDEATSALDSESEMLVQQALESLWENKTVIAIAHRLSTIQKMDRIVVMEDGRIAEQGSHKELVRHNGIYASLWSHQSGGFLDE